MTIGITGATGHLGRLVVQDLISRGAATHAIALVRSPPKAADLGIPAREADYDRPETLRAAFQGVDTLLLISANEVGKRAVQHRNALDAAREAGVQRIIYTSLLHADTSVLDLAAEHLATEGILKDLGGSWTILRNGWYTENYTGSLGGALAGGAVVGSAGDGRISSAARSDFAEAAVAVLLGEGHEGKTYELAGDEAWTLRDLAAEVSRQTGREIPYRNLPAAEYASLLEGFGLPAPLARSIAGWDVAASRGALFDDSRQLSRLIGRATTPLSQTVAEALAVLPPA